MKRKLTVFFALMLLCGLCRSQQVVSSGGCSTKGEVTVDWIIGGSLCDIPLTEEYNTGVTTKEELAVNGTGLKVFPNPAHDLLNIEITPSDTGRIVIELMNSSGRKMWNRTLVSETALQVDLTPFIQGVYFLKIFSSGSDMPIWIEKIVKE